MKKSVLLGVAAVLLSIGAFLYWFAPGDPAAAIDPAMEAAAAAGGTGSGHVAPDTFVTGIEGLPGSLQGTEVDGELEVDAAGHLRITGGIRRLFDYFLSAVGEEPVETIIKRIRAYIRHKLPAGAAAEAERLLDSYIGYKRGLDAIPQAQSGTGQVDIEALRRQLQQVQALRSQFFSPEVIAAFFGDEDTYDRYTLERLAVLQDKSLTPAQRAARLAALEQQLPEQMRESIKVINQVQNLEALTQDWKKRGGTPAELRQIRESIVGAEAADRLESLDRENAQWDQRMNSWYAERAAVLANKSLSEQDRQAQLEALRNSRFSEAERARVQSLELMRDRGEVVNR
ncbi:MAG TPA: lipase secretion chaperone [Moraxellaceae bacterium]|nr:lipase secretion chaperone [Moraxellaceae bacterium]